MNFILKIRTVFFLFIFVIFLSTLACAEEVISGVLNISGTMIADQSKKISELSVQVKNIETHIEKISTSDEKLLEERIKLEGIEKDILQIGITFRPILNDINSKISEITKTISSENAADHEKEVALRKKKLEKEKDKINQFMGESANLLVQVNVLSKRISMVRRDLFRNTLFKRYKPTSALSWEAVRETVEELKFIRKIISKEIYILFHLKFYITLYATFLSFFCGIFFYFGGRYLLNRLIDKDNPEGASCAIKRLSVAFWSTTLPSAALCISFLKAIWLCDNYDILEGDVLSYFKLFLKNIFIVFFIYRFGRSVLSPDAPQWRLIPIEPRPGYILIVLSTFSSFVLGIDDMMRVASKTLTSSLSVTVLRSLCASLLICILIIAFARVKPFRNKFGKTKAWPVLFRYILYSLSSVIILSALMGYISFAQFLAAQIIITGTLLATAYIGLLLSRALLEEGSFARIFIGKRLKERYNLTDNRLDQLGLLTSVLITIFIITAFLPFVLLQWGFKWNDILLSIYKVSAGFQLGPFFISPAAFIWGIFVFVTGYILTRCFQKWMDRTILRRSHVDVGVRGSIGTVIGYAGIGLSVFMSISMAGIDLSNLAMIAGGLSLGIGFGLQNIVSNFVSGLILLFERPFKPGDWVTAGEFSGIVKKIRVRATEIETFQNQSIILPNSEIINNAVSNWTHRSQVGRIDIPIVVAHDSDIQKVHDTLLDVANAHPVVLKTHKIFVILTHFVNTGFVNTGIAFELRVFIPNISNGSVIKSDILFNIVEKFRQNDIKMSQNELCCSIKENPM